MQSPRPGRIVPSTSSSDVNTVRPASSTLEIFLIFLRLGSTSFGGPIAHLGYFRAEFVQRRRWLTERSYIDIVALSQFLPGPASSQAGFGIGLMRGGLVGALAAWCGFTMPSAILMLLFAFGAGSIADSHVGAGVLHGLKLVAVAIVAQAVMGMARSLCPDRVRASIATVALVVMLIVPWSLMQIATILLGGVAGWILCRADVDTTPDDALPMPVRRSFAIGCLIAFFVLLGIAFVPVRAESIMLWNAFYRSGALVFGGGHVMLPLLRDAVVVPGWVSENAFLAGYGAAQAVPGPLSTFAAYLGAASVIAPGRIAGAVTALVAIFVPGFLCFLGVLPFWHSLRSRPGAQAAMRGTNAAVVGLLGAALYNPVWTGGVRDSTDFAIAASGFVLLVVWRAPPLLVVVLSAFAGVGVALAG
jgi:chromate transporter